LKPSRRSWTAILRLFHIGLPLRRFATARVNALARCFPRGRCGLRLKGSGCRHRDAWHQRRQPPGFGPGGHRSCGGGESLSQNKSRPGIGRPRGFDANKRPRPLSPSRGSALPPQG
jgi:hypothetical protein